MADSAASFVPQTRSNTVFFKAGADGVVRIVLQRANFCHAYWNTVVMRLGAADLVEDMAMRQLLSISFTLVALVVLALVNLGASLVSKRRSAFLLLAAACLLIAVKGSLDDPKPLMLLAPDLDWYLGHRLEHSTFLLSMTVLALFWWRSLEPMIPRSLAAMGRVRETYLQNLVHEIKTPLAVIAGYSGLTRMQLERGALDAESAEHLRVAEVETARLGRMIDGADRVGLGQTAGGIAMRDEDAEALLADAAAFCGPVCQKHGNRVEARSKPGLMVRCDRDLVLQALYNLVINASCHCEDSVIELSA